MSDMTFKDGILQGALWVPSPNKYTGFHMPVSLLVNHYTASGGANARSDGTFFQSPQAKAAAHFIVGRDGDIVQCVSIHDRAWHAGVSSWRGVPNCNDYAIGVEYDNYGYVTSDATGHFHPGANPSAVLEEHTVGKGQHKNTAVPYQWWELYTTPQIEAGIQLTNAVLAEIPTIRDIVGHEDIAPQRKIDPGPLFPWQHFLASTIGRAEGVAVHATVTATALNVRNRPSTTSTIVGKLAQGAEVIVVYDVPGEWAQISSSDGKLVGYVSDQYLARK